MWSVRIPVESWLQKEAPRRFSSAPAVHRPGAWLHRILGALGAADPDETAEM
jgi:hypothetical protein